MTSTEKPSRLPQHIAIIMDGNGRWARARMLPRYVGHREGVKAVKAIVEACRNKGIRALTLFAFSSENWRRPRDEVGLLMDLFIRTLKKEIEALHRNAIRVRFIGDRDAFPEGLHELMTEAEEKTRANTAMDLVIAANYGGKWDITRALQVIARRVAAGEIKPDDITPDMIGGEIALEDLPEPDLFIRTGGEQRISNFLLWQLAYTELYFTDVLWPAFNEHALDEALQSFASRQRRFGRTGDQVEQLKGA
ncbi:MAG: isoprenyl transferase [Gammaproteobacteria bacterium]|nr:isoprenyl transferase [Gammaproteobacteria bacterium]